QVAHIQGQPWKQELQKFLRQYRATPHSTTNVSPFEALTGRKMRTQLPQVTFESPLPDSDIRENDNKQKAKMKAYADEKRHARDCGISEGDAVLVRQRKQNKLSTPFNPHPLRVTTRNGNMVTAERPCGQRITRNVTHFKRVAQPHLSREEEREQCGNDLPAENYQPVTRADIEPVTPPVESPADIVLPVPNPDISENPSSSTSESSTVPSRRSTRIKSAPVRFKDYVMVCYY
ncbi:MAG: hypothetical protein MJA29_14065, partial [Candidatus Omnitrophica bacterium]|nr:hypothetical protein [Candidatus Omnitrophota bacterium]